MWRGMHKMCHLNIRRHTLHTTNKTDYMDVLPVLDATNKMSEAEIIEIIFHKMINGWEFFYL